MSRKNFKVDTAQKGQTPNTENKHPFVYKKLNTVEKTNVPTGKVKSLVDKKKRREAREKQYREFRIAALKRRAARMGIPEEHVKKLVEKLCEQLDAPKKYMILVLFQKGNKKMIMEMLKNNNIEVLLNSDSHLYVKGDQELLKKIRELMPEGTKIYPYAEKQPSVLPTKDPPKKAKKPLTKAEHKKAAAAAKLARKKANKDSAKNRKKNRGKALAKLQKKIRLIATKREKAETVAIKKKKSNQLKKAA